MTLVIYVAGFVTDSGTGGFEWRTERADLVVERNRWIAEGEADIAPIRRVQVPSYVAQGLEEEDLEAITIWLDGRLDLWEPEEGQGRDAQPE